MSSSPAVAHRSNTHLVTFVATTLLSHARSAVHPQCDSVRPVSTSSGLALPRACPPSFAGPVVTDVRCNAQAPQSSASPGPLRARVCLYPVRAGCEAERGRCRNGRTVLHPSPSDGRCAPALAWGKPSACQLMQSGRPGNGERDSE